MSVARSAYRQLLRVGTKVSGKYTDLNDMCFALFGLLVTRQDFMNAGYGGTFPIILRTCFLRPSVCDDPHDTVSARISAAFDALRRLNEINGSHAAFRIRELRRQMSEAAQKKESSTSAEKAGDAEAQNDSAAATATAPPAATGSRETSTPVSAAGVATTTTTTSSTSSLSSSTAISRRPPVMSAAEALAAATAGAAHTSSSHAKSGSTTYRLDEGVDLIRGSVLIERSSRRRIQNFPRHCVVCEPISMVFPPYRFCVPPEPAYLLAVRNEFALYGITDVLLTLSATSIFNAHRLAYLRDAAGDGATPTAEGDFPARTGIHEVSGAGVVAPSPRTFPTTREELRQLVRRVPTRTVVQTDVLEVEITTEYVCSNPASFAGGASPSSRASATSTTAAAGPQRRGKPSADSSAFTSTTPLKGGAASPAAGAGGSGRRTGVTSTASATAGPGSALAEDDDTNAHLFLYYVYVRNRGPQKNPHRWHAQILSHHLVVVDVAQAQVLEMGRPGVMGNFPLLPPGASHCFESGTTLSGREGLIRGSIQVNLFNDAGEMMMLDAAIGPTRLTVEVTSASGFTSAKSAKEELVQRTREDASDAGSDK
jgi:uncharacterized protein affecting Mg2+/Co2+ transport